ncbi:MAG: endonuclease domain-containing protein [Armatimonadota bacterium]|jgi:very-short-patch-repair endonuclease
MQEKPKHTVEGVAHRSKIEFAREQRQEPTRSEEILWEAVRRKQLGVRIRRQHPIDTFVLDFYCAEARLAIEVDGPVHDEQQGYDRWRDKQLATWGIEVMRVPEERVRKELAVVLAEIRDRIHERLDQEQLPCV